MFENIINMAKGVLGSKFTMPERLAPKVIVPASFPLQIDFNNARKWSKIVMHHSYTPDGVNTNDWEGIRKYHMSYRYNGDTISAEKAAELKAKGDKGVLDPWPTIAYHFGVEEDKGGLIYRLGCPLSKIGYHAKGFNSAAIGICLVGNYGGNFDGSDGKVPTSEQYNKLAMLVKHLMKKFSIKVSSVYGHRETYPLLGEPVEKTCPGTKFNMIEFRKMLV